MINRKLMPYFCLPLLILGGYFGNSLNLSLFFGVDFIFGSIFALIIVYYYGAFWGILSAAVIGSYTLILWKHPYALVALIAEACFLSWQLHKNRKNIVLLDSIYWFLIGIPFIFITYHFALKMTPLAAGLIMLKQAVNGIFNALIANFIILGVSLFKQKFTKSSPDRLSFEQTIFNLLVAFTFFPLLFLTVLNSQQAFRSMENAITMELGTLDEPVISSLRNWYQEQIRGLSSLAETIEPWVLELPQGNTPLELNDANPLENQRLSLISLLMQTTQKAFPAYSSLYLSNAKGQIITSIPKQNEVGEVLSGKETKEGFSALKNPENLQVHISEIHRDDTAIAPHLGVTIPFVKNQKLRGSLYGSLIINQINSFLENNVQDNQEMQLAMLLLDEKKRVIGSSQSQFQAMETVNLEKDGKLRKISPEVFHWLPNKPSNPMKRWRESYYYSFVSLGKDIPWQLVFRLTAEPQINELQVLSLKNLVTLLVLTALGLLISIFVSRRVAFPLLRLAKVTTDIPKKILDQEQTPSLPYSPITEIVTLSSNFEEMIRILKEQFGEILTARNTLETRVQERTKELITLNDNLAKEIVQRQAIANRLQDSEERYDLAVSGTNDGIWDWNIENDEVYYSPVWMKILGYQPKELPFTLSTWLDKIHPNELPLAQNSVQEHLVGHTEIYNFVHRLRHKDNHYLWIEAKGKCLRNEQGQAYRMVGTITDITAQKQAEEDLRLAKENAEIANRTKSEFLANMSHEIRTPMNAILGFCELLQGATTDPRSQSYLEAITTSGKALMSLINDILDLTKIEAGKLQLHYETVNITQLISEIDHIFSEKAERKNIQLSHRIAANIPQYLSLDEVRIRQILFNMLGNAIKFTERGEVKVVAMAQNVTPQALDLILKVEDTGIGIAPEDQQRIFDVFTQSEGQSTRKYGGTGLGLTITKRLIEILGGRISLESYPGQGSIFTLSFPEVKIVSASQLVPETAINENLEQFAPATILVVDDVKSNRDLICNYFSHTDHQILEAADGIEAIQMAQNHHPDLILMDLLMPNLDGIETTLQLRQDTHTHAIPIVILTAALLTEIQPQLEGYCQGFLSKPVTRRDLVMALQGILPMRVKTTDSSPIAVQVSESLQGKRDSPTLAPSRPIAIASLPGELSELTANLLAIEKNTWETLRYTMIMRDLRQFSKQLRQWGEDYQSQILIDYVEELDQKMRNYDWENLLAVINRFPKIRESLTLEL